MLPAPTLGRFRSLLIDKYNGTATDHWWQDKFGPAFRRALRATEDLGDNWNGDCRIVKPAERAAVLLCEIACAMEDVVRVADPEIHYGTHTFATTLRLQAFKAAEKLWPGIVSESYPEMALDISAR